MDIKVLHLPMRANLQDFGEQFEVRLSTDVNIAKEICLSLLLLKELLIKSLELQLENCKVFFTFNDSNQNFCPLIDSSKNVLKLSSSLNSLEYIINFLLIYYRDGFGQAEHIDIDFEHAEGSILTLTLIVKDYTEPSAEEMRRRLDI